MCLSRTVYSIMPIYSVTPKDNIAFVFRPCPRPSVYRLPYAQSITFSALSRSVLHPINILPSRLPSVPHQVICFSCQQALRLISIVIVVIVIALSTLGRLFLFRLLGGAATLLKVLFMGLGEDA